MSNKPNRLSAESLSEIEDYLRYYVEPLENEHIERIMKVIKSYLTPALPSVEDIMENASPYICPECLKPLEYCKSSFEQYEPSEFNCQEHGYMSVQFVKGFNKGYRTQSLESSGLVQFKKLEIWKDDDCEGFAAFCAGSSKDKPMIVLNIGSTLIACLENNIDPKEILIENLMHEFGHFLEEMFNKEFDEDFIEKVIQSYRDKYRNIGTQPPPFPSVEDIEWLIIDLSTSILHYHDKEGTTTTEKVIHRARFKELATAIHSMIKERNK